ncbi:Frizzled/Smoothened family membrane region [Dictyocaulus viviparus]|uniref:Frizzled/Smoothened family membrane region n=1 Tax=Dictyocaulus viviparus TaxID=29172 RepID=A0A0D8XCF5_DICVI|nr:Frizzled/Smoothened family membrane region [Dictyocaulus viviparus]
MIIFFPEYYSLCIRNILIDKQHIRSFYYYDVPLYSAYVTVSLSEQLNSHSNVAVKADCSSILEEFGISWPEPLDCSRFPQEPELCMNPDENRHGYEKTSNHRHRLRPSSLSCPHDLLDIDPLDNEGVCAYKCGADVMFSSEEKAAARTWMIVWGGFDFVVSLFTFLTFLIERNRFRFPERYLSASRKWVPEGIDACSIYLHVVAWGTAALMTIIVLVMQKGCNGGGVQVDASELSGVCSVGNTDPVALVAFSLVPRVVFVCIGTCFVIAGFASMCRERDSFRRRGTDTSKLDKLMFKMGLFCLLYIFPAVTQILCDIYALNTMKKWYPTTIRCKSSGGVEGGHCHRPHLPQESFQAEIYHLNLMMSLMTGVSCAMWVLSSKTLLSWHRALCCGLCRMAPQKPTTSVAATRPLLEPPTAPPPHPPSHYVPMSTHSQNAWRPSKVV